MLTFEEFQATRKFVRDLDEAYKDFGPQAYDDGLGTTIKRGYVWEVDGAPVAVVWPSPTTGFFDILGNTWATLQEAERDLYEQGVEEEWF